MGCCGQARYNSRLPCKGPGPPAADGRFTVDSGKIFGARTSVEQVEEGRELAAHDARAADPDGVDASHGYPLSRTVAIPWPVPMHIVASPYLPPCCSITLIKVVKMRAPDAPSG